MVFTRSMSAKLHNPNYTIEYTPNTYNPDNRISLVSELNIKNRDLTLYDMYDIFNDIKYKSNKNGKVIENNDLRPLLFSTMGIFYDKINKTILKIKKSLPLYTNCVVENEWVKDKRILRETLTKLEDIDIQFRQSGVNCHFGDFNPDNGVLEGFTEEEISHLYSQVLTSYNIIQMDLFADLKNMIDNYIYILELAVKSDSSLKEYFSEELCEYNFTKDSVYGYISNIKFVVMSE